MLCSAPIKNVYHMALSDKGRYNSMLLTDYSLEFHATYGHWLVLETAEEAIRLGYDGVQFFPNYWSAWVSGSKERRYANDFPFEGEIFTLLYGEHLRKVVFHRGKLGFADAYHELVFDHLSLKLYCYGQSDWKWFEFYRNRYCRPMNIGNHLLKRKCDCGGEGQLWIDHNEDYLVRCKSCHRSTEPEMGLRFVIDQWNEGKTPRHFISDEEMFLDLVQNEPIEFLAVHQLQRNMDDNVCEAEELMIGIRKGVFHVRSNRVAEAFYVPAFDCHSLPTSEDIRNIPGRIEFCCVEEDQDGKRLRFLVDDAQLLVTPNETGLTVGISFWDRDGKLVQSQRETLFAL